MKFRYVLLIAVLLTNLISEAQSFSPLKKFVTGKLFDELEIRIGEVAGEGISAQAKDQLAERILLKWDADGIISEANCKKIWENAQDIDDLIKIVKVSTGEVGIVVYFASQAFDFALKPKDEQIKILYKTSDRIVPPTQDKYYDNMDFYRYLIKIGKDFKDVDKLPQNQRAIYIAQFEAQRPKTTKDFEQMSLEERKSYFEFFLPNPRLENMTPSDRQKYLCHYLPDEKIQGITNLGNLGSSNPQFCKGADCHNYPPEEIGEKKIFGGDERFEGGVYMSARISKYVVDPKESIDGGCACQPSSRIIFRNGYPHYVTIELTMTMYGPNCSHVYATKRNTVKRIVYLKPNGTNYLEEEFLGVENMQANITVGNE